MTHDDHPTRDPENGFPQVPPGLAGILSFVAPGLGTPRTEHVVTPELLVLL